MSKPLTLELFGNYAAAALALGIVAFGIYLYLPVRAITGDPYQSTVSTAVVSGELKAADSQNVFLKTAILKAPPGGVIVDGAAAAPGYAASDLGKDGLVQGQ